MYAEKMFQCSFQVAGGMEAHLRNRQAPGVPLAAPTSETDIPTEEGVVRRNGTHPQLDAASSAGGEMGPAGEALSQEIGLLKASLGMVSSRLKELQNKAENDQSFTNFARTWLENQAQRAQLNSATSRNGTEYQQLAARVGAFAAGVGRAVEALTAYEQAETEEVAEQEAA